MIRKSLRANLLLVATFAVFEAIFPIISVGSTVVLAADGSFF